MDAYRVKTEDGTELEVSAMNIGEVLLDFETGETLYASFPKHKLILLEGHTKAELV